MKVRAVDLRENPDLEGVARRKGTKDQEFSGLQDDSFLHGNFFLHHVTEDATLLALIIIDGPRDLFVDPLGITAWP
jgi:hypothetical protein